MAKELEPQTTFGVQQFNGFVVNIYEIEKMLSFGIQSLESYLPNID